MSCPGIKATLPVLVLVLLTQLQAQQLFQAARNFPVSVDSGATGIAVGDFNNDGIPDVVVASFGTTISNNVAVLLGQSNGTLGPPTFLSAGEGPMSVVVGDFNGDKNLDIAVLDAYGPQNVSVLLGNGNGTFQPAVGYVAGEATGNLLPQAIITADFNGDGYLDLAVISGNGISNNGVAVMLGFGNGAFNGATFYNTLQSPVSLATGDFNGDGILDLVAVGSSGGSLLLGIGNGGFQSAVNIKGAGGGAITVGDYNGDHDLDIAVASGNHVKVIFGNGNGTFQPAASYLNVFFGTNTIGTADLNHDGKPDLVVGNADNTINLLFNKGDGTFPNTKSYVAGLGPISVAFGSFNKNGNTDVVTADPGFPDGGSAVSLLLNRGDGALAAAQDLDLSAVSEVAFGDFNNDGRQDMAVVSGGGTVLILLGNGKGGIESRKSITVGGQLISIAAGDFNHDGKLDLAALSTGELTILLGDGDGTFQIGAKYVVPSGTTVVIADLNTGGSHDLAVGTPVSLEVLVGNGDGTFQNPVSYGFKTGGPALVVGDFNNDHNLDIVAVGSGFGGNPSLFLGNGDGTLQAATKIPFAPSSFGAGAGDFNGDGNLDLALDGNVLLGNGDGTFNKPLHYQAGVGAAGLVVADFNGDGKLDIAVANDGAANQDVGDILVSLGNGDGTFRKAQAYASNFSPSNLALCDLDGDGRPDLVSLDSQLTVFLNMK
ncbi:MAG TPA: VCBS repeat-containing protein [Terriglobales bacterium]|nr:VCBS repeat-containing protein [Terriglobales bacterium]